MAAKRFTVAFLIIVLFTTTVSAAIITTEPSELFFENVLSNGYAEKIITIESDGKAECSFSATGIIKDWISFEPETILTTETEPGKVKVIVQPPANTSLGIYEGYIIVDTVSTGSKLTGAMTVSTSLKTRIKITDREIRQAIVKNLTISDTQQGSPIKVLAAVANEGNIKANIEVYAVILDNNQEEVTSRSNLTYVLPSAISSIDTSIPNNLEIGEYTADVTILLDGLLLRKDLYPFKIIEKGAVPEEPVIFKEEPAVPLAANIAIILLWVFIFLFIVWKVAKPKKK